MPLYRVYTLSKSDHIERRPSIVTCANDQEAIERAKSLMDGHDIELWDGVRFVTRVKAESTDPHTRKSTRRDQSRRTRTPPPRWIEAAGFRSPRTGRPLPVQEPGVDDASAALGKKEAPIARK